MEVYCTHVQTRKSGGETDRVATVAGSLGLQAALGIPEECVRPDPYLAVNTNFKESSQHTGSPYTLLFLKNPGTL